MIVHCEKHEDEYFYCHQVHELRRREDRQLEQEVEQELRRMFPGELRAVRRVREGEG